MARLAEDSLTHPSNSCPLVRLTLDRPIDVSLVHPLNMYAGRVYGLLADVFICTVVSLIQSLNNPGLFPKLVVPDTSTVVRLGKLVDRLLRKLVT